MFKQIDTLYTPENNHVIFVIDTDFKEIIMVEDKDWTTEIPEHAKAIIKVYEGRALNVTGNLAMFFKLHKEKDYNTLIRFAGLTKGFEKYKEDVEKLMVLI